MQPRAAQETTCSTSARHEQMHEPAQRPPRRHRQCFVERCDRVRYRLDGLRRQRKVQLAVQPIIVSRTNEVITDEPVPGSIKITNNKGGLQWRYRRAH